MVRERKKEGIGKKKFILWGHILSQNGHYKDESSTLSSPPLPLPTHKLVGRTFSKTTKKKINFSSFFFFFFYPPSFLYNSSCCFGGWLVRFVCAHSTKKKIER